jgi:glycosyltransferase involved in cell wall biosynthesis
LKITDNVIFVDSDSSDNSISIAKHHNIKKIIRVKANHGTPALSRFVGAKEVETEFIQFLDGDMEIENTWVAYGVEYLKKNRQVAAVHGYKKVYKHDLINYHILSDKKDWQADYLQGAFLIRRKCYIKAGGFDYRFHGEEERDLYIRLKTNKYQVWYLHQLMSSHYDFKKKTISYILFSGIEAGMWIPLLKSIKHNRMKSYLFVYRALLLPLFCELSTVVALFLGLHKFIIFGLAIQTFEMFYCLLIKRRGYFLVWKAAILNIYKTIRILKRKVVYNIEYL